MLLPSASARGGSGALVGPPAASGLPQRPGAPVRPRPAGPQRCRARPTCISRALGDASPWDTLHVAPDADVPTIRRAYRKLALKHHPDHDPRPEAPAFFKAIHEAYELLTGRRRGKEDAARPAAKGWDFHDWYWSFMSRRRQAGSKAGPQQPQPQPLSSAHLEQQLAGLRRKAACRSARRRSQPAAAEEPCGMSAAAAAASAWPQQPGAERAAASSSGGSGEAGWRPAEATVRSNAVTLRPASPQLRRRPAQAAAAGPSQPQTMAEGARQPAVAVLERPAQQQEQQQQHQEQQQQEQEADAAPQQIRSQLVGLRRRAALRQQA